MLCFFRGCIFFIPLLTKDKDMGKMKEEPAA